MTCKQGSIALVLGMLISIAHAGMAQAELITVTRTNTDDIVVPRFDTNLGTLNGVSLAVTLLDNAASLGGNHAHGSVTLSSTNTFSSTPLGFSVLGSPSAVASNEGHVITTPLYSGGGLSIGAFSQTTNPLGGHAHTLTVTHTTPIPLGLTGNWRARVIVSAGNAPSHAHTYDSQTKNLLLSGGDLAPFTAGVGDITIPAGAASTSVAGVHSASVSFSGAVRIGPSSFVATSFSGTLPSAGNHTHSYDPRFSVSATFDYTPVPEPGSGALAAAAMIGLAGVALPARRRRKR